MFKRIQIQISKQYVCECSCKHTNSNSKWTTHTHSSHKCSLTTAACSREIKTNFDKVDACVNTSAYKHNEHIHTVIIF